MQDKIYIYTAEGKLKVCLNYTLDEFKKEWYEDFQEGDIISEIEYQNPIVKNGKIREMTREERILILNQEDLLADGEVLADGEIKYIECKEDFVQAKWNKELNIWEEGADKKSLMLDRKNKILEYHKLKEEIAILKEMQDEFESDGTVELMEDKLNTLKNEINNLGEKIKKIK